MADVIYKRGQLANLNESTVPIKDGQLIVGYDLTDETGKLFMDIGTKRCEIIGGSEESGEGNLPIQENGGIVLNDQETNKAIAEFSTAAGTNSIAGWMGYPVIYANHVSDDSHITLVLDDTGIDSAINYYAVGDIVNLDHKSHTYDTFVIDTIKTVDEYDNDLVRGDPTDYIGKTAVVLVRKDGTPIAESSFALSSTPEDNWLWCIDKLAGIPIAAQIAPMALGSENIAAGNGAFTAGRQNKSNGDYSATVGRANRAGYASFAAGRGNNAMGMYAFAAGANNEALGTYSAAFGQNSTAFGQYSFALGERVTAYGARSVAFGSGTSTGGNATGAAVFGTKSEANGANSFVGGEQSIANGKGSFAFGYGSITDGDFSVAMGYQSKASASGDVALNKGQAAAGYALAINNGTANGLYSFAQGSSTTSGMYAVALGERSVASGKNSISGGEGAQAQGQRSIALGRNTIASAENSFAFGTPATYTSNGETLTEYTTASGNGSVAFGYGNIASGQAAFIAGGLRNKAEGQYSFVAGNNSKATGKASAAIGSGCNANFDQSFAFGNFVSTKAKYQAVFGKFSKMTDQMLFGIGDGTGNPDDDYADEYRNAFSVFNDGHAEVRTQGETDNSVVLNKTLKEFSNNFSTKRVITREVYSSANKLGLLNSTSFTNSDNESYSFESGIEIISDFVVDRSSDSVKLRPTSTCGSVYGTIEGWYDLNVGYISCAEAYAEHSMTSPHGYFDTIYSQNGVTQTSARDAKENIKNVISAYTPMTMGLRDDPIEASDITAEDVVDFVRNMQPVTFNYKGGDAQESKQLGLIADDIAEHPVYKYIGIDKIENVEKKDEEGNVTTEEKRVLGLQALPLATASLSVCQSLLNKIDILEARIEELENR